MPKHYTQSMQLEPYLFFYGHCEEALEFYKKALGGDFTLNRFEGSPMAQNMPPDQHKKIMHATFNGPGFTFMASDGRMDKTVDPEEGNISLSLATSDAAEGERAFKALSEGGKVGMPLQDVFWGGKFGQFTDRFGVEWMISIH